MTSSVHRETAAARPCRANVRGQARRLPSLRNACRDSGRGPLFLARPVLLAGVILSAFAFPSTARAGEVTVFAAASLKDAVDEVVADWTEATGTTAVVSYAGSSALARQIEAGAPADVFISASVDWMNVLEGQGLVVAETRVDLLGNTLVLIAADESGPLDVADLPVALGEGPLAMALYDAVPAGVYGREALTSAGVWDDVVGRVAQAPNVRAALMLVATGEAPYGLVYATDAAAEPRVSVVAEMPDGSHTPITYPAAITAEGDGSEARAFLDFLQGAEADATFRRHGFAVR